MELDLYGDLKLWIERSLGRKELLIVSYSGKDVAYDSRYWGNYLFERSRTDIYDSPY
jgi:hypothetical protein